MIDGTKVETETRLRGFEIDLGTINPQIRTSGEF
jgi:hypothetical protein